MSKKILALFSACHSFLQAAAAAPVEQGTVDHRAMDRPNRLSSQKVTRGLRPARQVDINQKVLPLSPDEIYFPLDSRVVIKPSALEYPNHLGEVRVVIGDYWTFLRLDCSGAVGTVNKYDGQSYQVSLDPDLYEREGIGFIDANTQVVIHKRDLISLEQYVTNLEVNIESDHLDISPDEIIELWDVYQYVDLFPKSSDHTTSQKSVRKHDSFSKKWNSKLMKNKNFKERYNMIFEMSKPRKNKYSREQLQKMYLENLVHGGFQKFSQQKFYHWGILEDLITNDSAPPEAIKLLFDLYGLFWPSEIAGTFAHQCLNRFLENSDRVSNTDIILQNTDILYRKLRIHMSSAEMHRWRCWTRKFTDEQLEDKYIQAQYQKDQPSVFKVKHLIKENGIVSV